MDKVYSELALAAIRARETAYSPYSGITVGAALLSESGKIYAGANLENASYSLTICAERAAFATAISEGERRFSAIAIAGGRAGEAISTQFPPCGACRQVMAEFCSADFKVILVTPEGYGVHTLAEMLPIGFDEKYL